MKTATEQFADEFNRGIDEELARVEPKAKVLEFNDAPAQTNGHEGGAWDEETPPATSAGLVPAGGINEPELHSDRAACLTPNLAERATAARGMGRAKSHSARRRLKPGR